MKSTIIQSKQLCSSPTFSRRNSSIRWSIKEVLMSTTLILSALDLASPSAVLAHPLRSDPVTFIPQGTVLTLLTDINVPPTATVVNLLEGTSGPNPTCRIVVNKESLRHRVIRAGRKLVVTKGWMSPIAFGGVLVKDGANIIDSIAIGCRWEGDTRDLGSFLDAMGNTFDIEFPIPDEI